MNALAVESFKPDQLASWTHALQANVALLESLERPSFDYLMTQYNPKHVLDIGTGDGSFLLKYARAYPEILFTGIEQNPIFFKTFEDQLKPADLIHITPEEHTFNHQGFGNHFHMALSRFTMGHLSDPLDFLKGVYKSLRPGGIYVSFDGAVSMSKGIARGFWKDFILCMGKVFKVWGSTENYPMKAIPNLKKAGFTFEDQITRMIYLNSKTEDLFKNYIKTMLELFKWYCPEDVTDKKINAILSGFANYQTFDIPPYISITQTIAKK